MTSITARNAAALKARNGSTIPEVTPAKAPRKTVAKGNQAVAEGKKPETKVAPTPVDCHCGCGIKANLGRTYRPGHDARHASAVARAVLEGRTGAQDAFDALAPKLRDKAARMVDNAKAKETRKAKAAAIREAARQAMKAELAAL
jgi:hypothetical protein